MSRSQATERLGNRPAGVVLSPDGGRVRRGAAAVALVTAALPFLARLALNARVALPVDTAAWMEPLTTLGVVGPALAAVGIGLVTGADLEQVGLTFVGVFALLSVAVPAATLPSAAAVTGGGSLSVWSRLEDRPIASWRLLPVGLAIGGIGLSLSGSMGLWPSLTRVLGSHLALLGGAATPMLLAHGGRDWAFGGAVGGLLVAVGVSAPFVTGAVALVGGGVVSVTLLVMAAALCGLVTTASAAVRQRHLPAFCGAGLLLVAGVPATVPRALAAVLGLLLLIEPPLDGGETV